MPDEIFRLSTAHRMSRRQHPPVGSMAEWLQMRADARGDEYQLPDEDTKRDASAIPAQVNTVEGPEGVFESRWVAECGFGIYRGRQRGEEPCSVTLMVDPADPWFACPSSCALWRERGWRMVVFPDVELVERVLLERHPADRFAAPGERAADLAAENVAHGDPLPEGVELVEADD